MDCATELRGVYHCVVDVIYEEAGDADQCKVPEAVIVAIPDYRAPAFFSNPDYMMI